MLGVRKTVFENQHGNCLSGLVTSTRLGRGSIKSHVRTVKVLGMGLFAFQEHVHLWQGVTHWTLYQSRVPRVLRPFGIHAHIACGRCGFAAQKASQKAYPAVCGEEKALLRKCNNLLYTFQPCGLQSVVGPPRGNGGMGFVSGESLRTCVQKVGTHVRSKTAKFSYIWVAI